MSRVLTIVLGLSPTGLYAIRELGQAGVAVLGIDNRFQAGCMSRFLSHPSRYLLPQTEPELLLHVETAATEWDGPVVLLPTSDRYIEWLTTHAGRLQQSCRFAGAYHNGLAMQLMDKGSFARLCERHTIARPQQNSCASTELQTAARELRFPLLIKPARIHEQRDIMAGRKVFIASDEAELGRLAKQLQRYEGTWQIQEVIPGPDSNISLYAGYFDAAGEIQRRFSGRKLRQYPPGFGSASMVDNQRVEAAELISERLLQALSYSGIAGAEFKYDERDQQLKIIEINPRPTLWFDITRRAGLGLTLAAVLELAGEQAPVANDRHEHLLWRYFLKDTWSRCFYAWQGKRWILPAPTPTPAQASGVRTRRVGPLWDRADPAPLAGELVNYSRKAVARSLRRIGVS